MSALHDDLENGSMQESSADEGSVVDNDLKSMDGEDIEIEAGFVDLWEHSGCKGCKEFFSGRWRLLLTFTRLCDDAGQEDADVSNVYLVDIELSYIDV